MESCKKKTQGAAARKPTMQVMEVLEEMEAMGDDLSLTKLVQKEMNDIKAEDAKAAATNKGSILRKQITEQALGDLIDCTEQNPMRRSARDRRRMKEMSRRRSISVISRDPYPDPSIVGPTPNSSPIEEEPTNGPREKMALRPRRK